MDCIRVEDTGSGFQETGEYRKPRAGEFFRSQIDGHIYQTTVDWQHVPVNILKRKPTPPTTCVYELTGELRAPKKGEWFWSAGLNSFMRAGEDLSHARPIARCIAVPQATSKRYTIDGREVA